MDGDSLLQDFAVILVIAGVAGWIFRKLGLSAVVGFLIAGIIIGPHTPPFALVTDVERIEMLSEFGLVFLMFYVGLNLSLARISRMGFPVIAATAITAVVVFLLAQAFAGLMGWHGNAALIFAAMLMVSSSAIITKLLAECGLSHERFAQNATGATVLEDVVAVVMLTLIGSRLHGDGGEGIGQTLVMLASFVVLLVVGGLLVVPRVLRRLGRSSDADLSAILLAGLAFGAGWAAISAGFSVALGAFLFGVVIAETAFKARIEGRLAGAQDVFSSVFFVSIGMLIDIDAFVSNIGLVLAVSLFAIVARTLAGTLGFLATGNTLPLAAMSGMLITPIGEFSYIIAQTGVQEGAVPESFYAVAVGVSIVTAILAPVLARSASAIGGGIDRLQPAILRNGIAFYHRWLVSAGEAVARNHVWRLTRRQVLGLIVELLLLAGLLGFGPRLQSGFAEIVDRAGIEFPGLPVLFLGVGVLLVLVLVVSIWRSLQALSMVYAEALTPGADQAVFVRSVVQVVFQAASVVGLGVMVWVLMPVASVAPWIAGIVVLSVVFFAFLLRRRLVRWHCVLGASLSRSGGGTPEKSRITHATRESARPWNMQVGEVLVPEGAACSGKALSALALRSRFGCSIVEAERQGVLVTNPSAAFQVFPGDRLLLFGSDESIERGREVLEAESTVGSEESDFSETILTDVVVEESRHAGRTLRDLALPERVGVQIMGIERENQRILMPDGLATLQAGDRLLVLGSAQEVLVFRAWLSSGSDDSDRAVGGVPA